MQKKPIIIDDLRGFTKTSARKQWAFGSQRYIKNGFEATHALELDAHSSRSNMGHKDRGSLASLLLNIIVSTVYTLHDRQKCFELLERTTAFASIPNQTWSSVITISDAYRLFEIYCSASNLLAPLKIIRQFDDLIPVNLQSVRITSLYNEIRSDALSIYNTYLYKVVKKCNTETLKKINI